MARISFKERQRQAREAAILDTAQELMAVRGYAAMKMEELAEQVGLAKGSLYLHFPSKEALAVALLTRKWRELEQYLQSQTSEVSALTRLEDALHWMLCGRFRAGWPDILDIKPILAPWIDAHPEFDQQMARVSTLFGGLFEAAKSAGDIPKHLATSFLVRAFWSQARAYGMEALIRSGEYTVEQLSEMLTRQFFEGIRTNRI